MTLASAAIGIGLRQRHDRAIFESKPELGFVDVYSENFFLDGGASMHALQRARRLPRQPARSGVVDRLGRSLSVSTGCRTRWAAAS